MSILIVQPYLNLMELAAQISTFLSSLKVSSYDASGVCSQTEVLAARPVVNSVAYKGILLLILS